MASLNKVFLIGNLTRRQLILKVDRQLVDHLLTQVTDPQAVTELREPSKDQGNGAAGHKTATEKSVNQEAVENKGD